MLILKTARLPYVLGRRQTSPGRLMSVGLRSASSSASSHQKEVPVPSRREVLVGGGPHSRKNSLYPGGVSSSAPQPLGWHLTVPTPQTSWGKKNLLLVWLLNI